MAPAQPPAAPAADPLQAELAALAGLDLAALRARWRRLARKPAPAHLGRALLLRLVAYRLQAQAYGDLDRATARALDDVHRRNQRQSAPGQGRAVPAVPAVPDPRKGRLKPGTLLVRRHRDRVHRVMVLEAGYAYEGATYASLSEIARTITGTSWNGPRFFGLRDRRLGAAAARVGEAEASA